MTLAMGLLPAKKVVALPRRGRHRRHMPWSGAVAELEARVGEIERRLSEFDRRYAALDVISRMRVAVLVSVLIHVIVVFGVTFKMPGPPKPHQLDQPLEVVLVNAKSAAEPVQPDALAQHNLDGGGNTDLDRRASSPLPVIRNDRRTENIAAAAQRVKQLERQTRQLMTQ